MYARDFWMDEPVAARRERCDDESEGPGLVVRD